MHTSILVADNGNIYDVLNPFACYNDESSNLNAKFEYFEIGGRYANALLLKQPRVLRKFFGIFPAGLATHVSIAKKSEIDENALLSDPPDALFFRSRLYVCPLLAEGEIFSKWKAEFSQRFAEIPNDMLLLIVDAHS